LLVSIGGLTQHMQASHFAVERHAQRSPTPEAVDHEQLLLGDDMRGGDNHECGGEGARQPQAASTNFHPLIDG
jgi:hypothetical protein